MLTMSVIVLCQVVIERRTSDIVEILQNQAVVRWTDIETGRFPENGVDRDSANHDVTTVVREIASGSELNMLPS